MHTFDTRERLPAVTIRQAGRDWMLLPGAELTFGRGSSCDIRFAYEPLDDYVARHAGTLICQPDGVLVRNESATQGLVLQAFPGPEMAVGPRMTVGTGPHKQLRLVVPGRHGTRYALIIDARALDGDDRRDDAPTAITSRADQVPTRAKARVTPRELRLLAALCEPILILAGDQAVPATYRQIAERVGQRPQSVRVCLDQLRLRLTEEDGIPGLRGTGEQTEAADYRGPLARWALSSGIVTTADLRLLNEGEPG